MAGPDRRAALVAKFRAIAQQRLAKIAADFTALSEAGPQALAPDDVPQRAAELMREAHTLKGEAKLLGFPMLGEAAHRTEDALLAARARGFQVPRELFDCVLAGLDLMSALVGRDQPDVADQASVMSFAARVDAAVKAAQAEPSAAPPAPPADPTPAPAPTGSPAQPPAARGGARREIDFVRVPARRLVQLTHLTGSLILGHDDLDGVVADLERLVQGWSDELARLDTALAPLLAGASEELRRELSGRTGRLTRLAALGKETGSTLARARDRLFDAGLQLDQLQESVREMRLLDIGTLLEHYPAAIREMAAEHGKRVRVVLQGTDVAVDKQVLDRIDDPLIHLLRNAVDHGIEAPDERLRAGKPEQGTIQIAVRQHRGQVEIAVSDDGRGIDPQTVRAAAVLRGVMSAADADNLSDAEAQALVFRAGFSTRQFADETSGRGIGLDVVKQHVESLGGSVGMESTRGKGTRCLLWVPTSVALTQALVVRAAQGWYAVAASAVESATRIPRAAVEPAGAGVCFTQGEGRVPLVDLAEVLGLGSRAENDQRDLDVLVAQYGGRRLGLWVDKLVGQRQVVQHALDPFLSGLRLVSGTAALEGGRQVLFLNLPELFRVAADARPRVTPSAPAQPAVRPRARGRVLIVDDSELTRDMLVSLVGRLGYHTAEAIEGEDALRNIAAALPDLVLTDLDMPVLDGFALIERLRADAATRALPIVVLTTRGSEEDKRRAMAAGADAFLVKSQLREADLDRTLRLLLPHAVGGAA